MPNKSSPHGAAICEGTVSHGTLRTPDLLRSFAAELDRYMPFNGAALANEARDYADKVDAATDNIDWDPMANECLDDLIEQLNTIASREGFYFGNTEGDGSDFGFWKLETDDQEA